MTSSSRLAALLLGPALLAASAADADDPWTIGGYGLGASVTAGYRVVDVDGSTAKYREDYDLHSGPRLFNLDLSGVASDPSRAPLDRFHLVVETPGNEPVSSYRLTASDRQWWDVAARLTRSKYFYAVPELFEEPVSGDVRTDDLHDFDLTRLNGAVDVTLRPPGMPKVFLGYRLHQQQGDTSSTVFVPGGDTFLVRAPLDARTNVGLVGTELRLLGATVLIEEQYRRLGRTVGQHGPIPGLARGLDPDDASTLTRDDAVLRDQVNEPITIVRVTRPVGERVELAGSYLYSHADLDGEWTLGRTATTDVAGLSGDERQTGRAEATLDTHVADLGATVRVTDELRARVSYRFDEQSQSATFDADTAGVGPTVTATAYHVRLNRVTGDLAWEPRRNLTLRAGLRYAWRDANLSTGSGPQTTETLGVIADARWRPWRILDLFARYENAQVEDPYTIAGDPTGRPPLPGREIALTLTNRGQAGFTVRPRDWIRLRYRFLADSRENGTFDGHASAFANDVALSLTPLPSLSIVAAYTRRDLDAGADIVFAPTYATTGSVQAGSEDVVTSQITYDFGLWGQRWSTGCHVFYVQSDQHWRPRLEPGLGGRMLLDLDRIDGGASLTWHHAWVEPSVEVRVVDYRERVLSGNDYRATIVAVTLTRRFGAAAGD